ncbi:hypothetical protein NMG60_11034848, partial [Bertholletia excelsa]
MTPSACQGLQSCLEPWLVESRVLRHKLRPPKPKHCYSFTWPKTEYPKKEQEEEDNDRDSKNKSSANNGQLGVTDQNDKAYVHPHVKPSSSALGSKSLEMCTESLGSESSNEFFPLTSESHAIPRPKSREFAKKSARSDSFPPPLTSIRGSDGVVQVRRHREDGRLVIKAVTVASSNACFQAERVDGRLRLCWVKESPASVNFDLDDGEVAERVVEEHDENVHVDNDDGDDESDGKWAEDLGGNGENVGVKL